MANSKPDFNPNEWIASVLVVFCIFIPFIAVLLFHRPLQAPVCKVGSFGNVQSNTEVDGKLAYSTGGFAVRTPDNRLRFITHCFKGCSSPHEILRREWVGRPVHAEFCGEFLTLVAFDRSPIYIAQAPTQEELNQAGFSGRIAAFILLFGFFVLLCIGLIGKRKARLARNALLT